jgi:hypothetical protein
MNRYLRRGLAIALAALALDGPAFAVSSFYIYPMYTPDFMMSTVAQASLDHALRQRAAQRAGGAATRSERVTRIAFDYPRDTKLSRQIGAKVGEGIARLVNGPGATVERREQTKANFEGKDIAQEMVRRFAGSLPAYDMVTALAVYGAMAFQIIGQSDSGGMHSAALYQDLKDSYAQLPQAAQMSAMQRQRFAESLYWAAYLSGVMQALAEKQGDASALARLRQSTREHMQTLRLNPDRYRLTAKGLSTK